MSTNQNSATQGPSRLSAVDRLVGDPENDKRIANCENCFGSNGVPLSAPHRVLVGEGVLIKNCRKKRKPRQIFLFNDILVYGSILIKNVKYLNQHIIPLKNVKVEDIPDVPGSDDFAWMIKSPIKSFILYAASSLEKAEWISHINMCIKLELDKCRRNPPNLEHAAPWLPDSQSDFCMCCKKKQFTFINRRHHCRKCGIIVCGDCSKERWNLSNISSKPVRICDTCFWDLWWKEDRICLSRPAPPPQPKEETATTEKNEKESSDSDEEGNEFDMT